MSKTFIKAVLAGGAISLGGIANIFTQNKIIGSLFFTIGLFLVLTYDLNLFTGKICYIIDNKLNYWKDLMVIYFGNFVGAFLVGQLLSLSVNSEITTNYLPIIIERVERGFEKSFVLAIFCNILIFVAVDQYKTADVEWKKILALFFGVSTFVLCGFEHCVADMFYLSFCNYWTIDSILFLFFVTLGNICGALIAQFSKKIIQ